MMPEVCDCCERTVYNGNVYTRNGQRLCAQCLEAIIDMENEDKCTLCRMKVPKLIHVGEQSLCPECYEETKAQAITTLLARTEVISSQIKMLSADVTKKHSHINEMVRDKEKGAHYAVGYLGSAISFTAKDLERIATTLDAAVNEARQYL